jgi:hypothetical protein
MKNERRPRFSLSSQETGALAVAADTGDFGVASAGLRALGEAPGDVGEATQPNTSSATALVATATSARRRLMT